MHPFRSLDPQSRACSPRHQTQGTSIIGALACDSYSGILSLDSAGSRPGGRWVQVKLGPPFLSLFFSNCCLQCTSVDQTSDLYTNMEVAHVVASIISAFGNGMDLFRRMAGKKPKRRGREPTYSEQELWLRDSLERRPREIRDSYSKSVARLGHRFEIGDSLAHTSLAHTLLVLNSGLINLINQALSTDTKKKDLSRRSLLNLSEVAAADTLNALSQLSLRLSSRPRLSLPASDREAKSANVKTPKSKPRQEENSREATRKRPGPAPLLVRGGWVRPKSGSTVSSSSSKSRGSESKHVRSKSESAMPNTTGPPPVEAQPRAPQAGHGRHHSSYETHRPERQPSMLLVPSDFFTPLRQEPQSYETPPPRPPKIPLHSRPNPTHRPRPPSQGTMMTTSTKIGEIAEARTSRWQPTFSNEVQDPRLVQYLTTLPDGLVEEEPKKKGRGLKFWKKTEKTPAIAAY